MKTWAKENKVRHGFKIIGIYHDNPELVPSENCRSEIGIEIKGEANGLKKKNYEWAGPSMEIFLHQFLIHFYQGGYCFRNVMLFCHFICIVCYFFH